MMSTTTRLFSNLQYSGPGPNPKYLSARIPLPPGTHHIKFIVDGNMRISEDMPSAVDYTNVLVNWIEVSEHKPSAPRDIPQPRQVKQVAAEHRIPHVAPSSGSPGGTHVRTATPTTAVPILASPKPSPRSRPPTAKKADPSKVWHSKIPPFLADLDEAEDSSEFQRANQAMSAQPVPPTLPMFLNKSIMNSGGLPVKDDSSVLVIPNHTVLNHLATSSIKNNVLATSATTRYDGKVMSISRCSHCGIVPNARLVRDDNLVQAHFRHRRVKRRVKFLALPRMESFRGGFSFLPPLAFSHMIEVRVAVAHPSAFVAIDTSTTAYGSL